jgi:hypothetical protein
MNVRGYSSPKAFGHRLVEDILDGRVVIQEKIDGSQISFGVYEGELCVRSRNQQLDLEDAGMFQVAVDYLKTIIDKMEEGWTYRGEYLSKPKHNTLCYSRIPNNFIVLYDIDKGNTDYELQKNVYVAADLLNFGYAPILWIGNGKEVTLDLLKELLTHDSILGGVKVEGIVIKNYDKYLNDKVMMAKYVSPEFQEKHGKDWKQRHPGIIEYIVGHFNREAIWQKAVQHLAEAGELVHEPKDIGKLMKELNQDIEREHGEEIKEMLYKSEKGKIFKGITRGFPEWYKEQLAKQAFGEK